VHDWWRAPRTWARILATDARASHASWRDNFPQTRLPSTPSDADKDMVDTARLWTLPPFEARNLLEDGSFGGRSQRSDAEMQAIWEVAVTETREMLEAW
jgi:creatinine amidohydrolase